MKNKTLFLSIIIFLIIATFSNIITYQHESSFDGNDYIGWPFRYYEYLGGVASSDLSGRGFMPLFLILDLLIILAASVVISYLIYAIFIRKK